MNSINRLYGYAVCFARLNFDILKSICYTRNCLTDATSSPLGENLACLLRGSGGVFRHSYASRQPGRAWTLLGSRKISKPEKCLTRSVQHTMFAGSRHQACGYALVALKVIIFKIVHNYSSIFQKESLRVIFPRANSSRSTPRTSIFFPHTEAPVRVHSETPKFPQTQC